MGVKVKIELPCKRELNFQGPGRPKIDAFSILFLCLFWERLRSLFLADFGGFGAHFGIHVGALGRFFRPYFLTDQIEGTLVCILKIGP